MGTFYSPGNYWAKVTGQALSQTKTGKPQFVLMFSIVGKIDPSNPDGDLLTAEQGERTIYRVITDKTIPYLLEDLEKLEFSGGSFAELDPTTTPYQDFTGREIAVHCEHDEYEGVERERWSMARTGGLVAEPLDAKEIRKLDAMFGKSLGRQPAAPVAPPAESPPVAPQAAPEPPPEPPVAVSAPKPKRQRKAAVVTGDGTVPMVDDVPF